MPESESPIDSLSQKVIKIVGISILMILLTLLILYGFKVILLILAGFLFATFFRGIALHLKSWFSLSENLSLVLSVLLIIGICTMGSILLSPSVSKQMKSLQTQIPNAIEKTKEGLKGSLVGDFVISRFNSISNGQQNIQKKVIGFFNSVFGVIGDMYVIFFLGMFFMAQPHVYRQAIVRIFPQAHRNRSNTVLLTIAYTLKRWLLGKFLSMLIVGVFSTLGLFLLGVPMALTLGIFAGLITFIPNFGPLLSFIPAGLLASVQGTDQLLYTALLYIAIQAVETNLITPLIQKNLISLPMASILIAQVLLAVFTGALGIILAVPIVVIVMVLVKMLYLEDILHDKDIEVIGEEKFN